MTAVELLIEQITSTYRMHLPNWEFPNKEYFIEMEKQQIIDAYQSGDGDAYNLDATKQWGEEYYNETYGSKGSDDHIVDTNEMVSSQASEQIAIDFAEWMLDYNPTMLYQKTKKELFQEFLKTKQ